MTYDTFKSVIVQKIKQLLPPDTSVQLHPVIKNNGLKLDGLTISNSESNLSPTIFLNYYYENRDVFPDFDAICRDIMLTYTQNKSSEPINIDFFTDYKQIKEHLAYRIINYEKNKELLQTVPHFRYLDLAIVFYSLLNFSDKGHATILIRTNHLQLWHICADELYEQTCRTTPLLLPYDFRCMSDVLSDMFDKDDPFTQDVQNIQNTPDTFCPMYVLTNTRKLYGASCMLYPCLLEQISEKLQADLFILPSSVHEIIILPAANRSHYEELVDMVKEINRTELTTDEVLSDQIYYYSRHDQALSICS